MIIQVSIQTVFGKEKIYPLCEKAKGFARLVKQKTLTREDIQKIKLLGYSVEVIKDDVVL